MMVKIIEHSVVMQALNRLVSDPWLLKHEQLDAVREVIRRLDSETMTVYMGDGGLVRAKGTTSSEEFPDGVLGEGDHPWRSSEDE